MISYAFIDLDGLVISGGTKGVLPDGAIELPAGFDISNLTQIYYENGEWLTRPQLPLPVATETGFNLDVLPEGCSVRIIDQGDSSELNITPTESDYQLPENGEWEVVVSGPVPFLESRLKIKRGTGSPIINDYQLRQTKEWTLQRINTKAGQFRSKFYTDIPGQTALYLEKRTEALAYIQQQPETLDDFPLLQNEVGITAETAWELAQLWLNLSDLFKIIGGQTERARMTASVAIGKATDTQSVLAAEYEFDAALAALSNALSS